MHGCRNWGVVTLPCVTRRASGCDDDGDGIREVHDNTLEGLWTGLRNFLRQFRGVSKHYLKQYVAIFQWAYNLKRVTVEFLRSLLWGRRLTVGQT